MIRFLSSAASGPGRPTPKFSTIRLINCSHRISQEKAKRILGKHQAHRRNCCLGGKVLGLVTSRKPSYRQASARKLATRNELAGLVAFTPCGREFLECLWYNPFDLLRHVLHALVRITDFLRRYSRPHGFVRFCVRNVKRNMAVHRVPHVLRYAVDRTDCSRRNGRMTRVCSFQVHGKI